MKRPTFEQACASYVNRYTCEHKPAWARKPARNGKFYAPQYLTDREWYDNTLFPGETLMACGKYCYSTDQTWPHGLWIEGAKS